MRNLSLLLLCGMMLTACVDNDYDLAQLETDNVAIGGDQSTFSLPLATIRIGLSEIQDGSVDIRTILDEAKIWLPSKLDGDCADIARLQTEAAYLNKLLADLEAELLTSDTKMRAVTDLIWDNYRSRFISILPGNQTADQFYTAFKDAFRNTPALRTQLSTEIRNVASEYLRDVKIAPMKYDVSGLDLDDSVVDMLADNLDSEEVKDPRNVLILTGSIESRLPVSLSLSPAFKPTSIGCSIEVDALRTVNAIPEMRVYKKDLEQIAKELNIEIPVSIGKFYPARNFDESVPQIVIKLSLIKKGGLSFNL